MESAIAVRSQVIYGGLTMWLKTGAIAALVGFLYASVVVDLAAEWWTQPEASHGILIPPFALYIVYLGRRSTLSIVPHPDWRGLGLTFLACLILLMGQLASEFFLSRISLIFLIGGLIWTFWGVERLRSLAFPLILLATMVPLPGIVYKLAAAPLQLFASKAATALAQLLGVSIYRDGNIIHLASISLGVAEACSGLHSLSALVVASLILGFLKNASILGRVCIVLISLPLAVVVNVLRVTGTAILADYNLNFAMGYYHGFSGWVVFLIGFGLLWLMANLVFRFMGSHS
jgi:exosortase